jgi:hypothetical protein
MVTVFECKLRILTMNGIILSDCSPIACSHVNLGLLTIDTGQDSIFLELTVEVSCNEETQQRLCSWA